MNLLYWDSLLKERSSTLTLSSDLDSKTIDRPVMKKRDRAGHEVNSERKSDNMKGHPSHSKRKILFFQRKKSPSVLTLPYQSVPGSITKQSQCVIFLRGSESSINGINACPPLIPVYWASR
ncbi:unnamed protein product [Cochlearia groenlandica]